MDGSILASSTAAVAALPSMTIVTRDRDIRRPCKPASSSSASFCKPCLCSLVVNRRNWTQLRHSGIAHDAY
jgi:hypothetical protein